MYSLAIIVVLGVTWIAWHLLNKALYGDALSPFNLLLYCWVIPFVLCVGNLSGLQTGLGFDALLIIVGVTAILVLTCMLPAQLKSVQRRYKSDGQNRKKVLIRPIGIVSFYVVTVVALYFAEFKDRDLPLLVYLLGDATDSNLHTAGKDSKLQIVAFGIYSAAAYVFFLWLHEKRWLRRAFYFVLAAAVIALGLVKASKSDVYIPMLSYAGLTYYYYRRNGLTIPAAYKVAAFVMFFSVISITVIRLQGIGLVGGYAGLIEFRYTDLLGNVMSEIVSIAYGYVALGFQNFSNYIDSHTIELRLGTSFFRPLLSLFMHGDMADAMGVPVDQWNVVSDAANTGTFLTPLYIEGGPVLCFLGALVYGLMVNLAYFEFRSTNAMRWMFVYTSFMFPWTWLFFTNAFSVLSIYANVFYVFLLSWLFVRVVPSRRAGKHLEMPRAETGSIVQRSS